MEINLDHIKKNLGTFTNAYGLNPKSSKLISALENDIKGDITQIGVILRDSLTKKGLIICKMPIKGDYADQMVWVPIHDKNLEAAPIFSRISILNNMNSEMHFKKYKMTDNPNYDQIDEECGFTLLVHRLFRTHGVIEKYIAKKGYGFIRRNRRDIFFLARWCNFKRIQPGQEVSFMPIISKKGLQAKIIEQEVT